MAIFNVTRDALAQVKIVGCGRGVTRRFLKISSTSNGKVLRKVFFTPLRSSILLGPVQHAMGDVTFGIELEMSSARHETASDVAASISRHSGIEVADMKEDFRLAKSSHHTWCLMHDSSLVCTRGRPDCNLWELKSRILTGEGGLEECERVIKAAQSQASIKLNKSMGFHIHVGRSGFDIAQLRNICLMFLRFEGAMDSFMPESRRGDNNEYGASNRNVVGAGMHSTHAERREILMRCNSVEDIVDVMNPEGPLEGGDRVRRGGRYFKLNLRTGDKDTFEFRQHSATANSEKVTCFVRFCVAFVHNSADMHDLPPPNRDDDEFEQLFKHVIKDWYLRDYYLKRRSECGEMEEHEHAEPAAKLTGSEMEEELHAGVEPDFLCRRPATLTQAERDDMLRGVSLGDRSAYFGVSTCPITIEKERLMEGISKAMTAESYGNLWDEGIYQCARCRRSLYSSRDKWRAHCIWPTFRSPIMIDSLETITVPEGSYNNYRCEVREVYCGSCHLFLGHQFLDGREHGDIHPEAKWRHCTLSLSLNFCRIL